MNTGSMNLNQLDSFIGNVFPRETRSMSSLSSVVHKKGETFPRGSWPLHWRDVSHEEDGGSDHLGSRPQNGIQVMKDELQALYVKHGVCIASDDVTQAELSPDLVKAARQIEMDYFEKMQVYDRVPRDHQKHTHGKIVGVRWVDINKGDIEDPNYRSRLVAREFNTQRDDTLYASTPPLEALRLVVSHAATWDDKKEERRRCIMINDVRRAYFYAVARRDLYIELPEEDPMHGQGMLGKLRLCLYGTRDAAKAWQDTLSAQLAKNGFIRGVGHPSVFHHPKRQIWTLVHGDDYVSAGAPDDLQWLEEELGKSYELQTQKLGDAEGMQLEGKVLNRIVRMTPAGWETEADPRHAELIIEQLGLGNARRLDAPGSDGKDDADQEDDKDLEGADITKFRGVAARGNYLSFDRPDLQYAIKEICREMSKPTTASLRRLQRVGRYLLGKPRMVWKFGMQSDTHHIEVFTDSDWAGCQRARKSTNGGKIR